MSTSELPFNGEIVMAILTFAIAQKNEHGDRFNFGHVGHECEAIADKVMENKPNNITLSPNDKQAVLHCLRRYDVDDMNDYDLLQFYVEKILPKYEDYIDELVVNLNGENVEQ